MSTPRDFDNDTWFTRVPLMFRTEEAFRVFRFCLEPISINSVLDIKCEFVSDQPFVDI